MSSDVWEVRVTQTAYEDLREAATYMRDRLCTPKSASMFIDAFESTVANLSTFPEGRPPVSDYALAKQGYRWTPVGDFMLFYTVQRDTRTVMVERLLYGSRDWKSLL